MADSYGPWRKSYSHRRPSIWCSAVYVDGICLCLPVIRIPLFRTHHRTLSQANCRCHCRFFRLFTSVSDNTLCFSSLHGATGRTVPRFLHRLSAQDRYELFWGSDVGHRNLWSSGCCHSPNCGYHFRCNIWFGICFTFSPIGRGKMAVPSGRKNLHGNKMTML